MDYLVHTSDQGTDETVDFYFVYKLESDSTGKNVSGMRRLLQRRKSYLFVLLLAAQKTG